MEYAAYRAIASYYLVVGRSCEFFRDEENSGERSFATVRRENDKPVNVIYERGRNETL